MAELRYALRHSRLQHASAACLATAALVAAVNREGVRKSIVVVARGGSNGRGAGARRRHGKRIDDAPALVTATVGLAFGHQSEITTEAVGPGP